MEFGLYLWQCWRNPPRTAGCCLPISWSSRNWKALSFGCWEKAKVASPLSCEYPNGAATRVDAPAASSGPLILSFDSAPSLVILKSFGVSMNCLYQFKGGLWSRFDFQFSEQTSSLENNSNNITNSSIKYCLVSFSCNSHCFNRSSKLMFFEIRVAQVQQVLSKVNWRAKCIVQFVSQTTLSNLQHFHPPLLLINFILVIGKLN